MLRCICHVLYLVKLYLVTDGAMKSQWEATASSYYTPENLVPGRAIDGILTLSSAWANTGRLYAWLKVKMDRERWVMGIAVNARPTVFTRIRYTEVFVIHLQYV